MILLKYCIFFTLSLIFTTGSKAHPICIIGGGISGLTIATLLQENYDVELYEAATKFGGKLNTYRENGALLERGPIIFTEQEPHTKHWLKKFKIKTIPYNVSDHAIMLPSNGQVIPIPSDDAYSKRVEYLSKIYKKEWNKYPNSTWEFGYSKTNFSAYPDLAGSIDAWLKKRGLSELAPYFIWYITIEGYGDLRFTPALYALKLFSADKADFFFELGNPAQTVEKGFDEFAAKIGVRLKKKFRRREVIKINKQVDGSQLISFSVNGSKELQTKTCGKTILAFPLLYHKLKDMINPMTNQERKIFQAVRVKKYASSGLNIPLKNLTHRVYVILQPKPSCNGNGAGVPQFEYPEGDGNLLALTRQNKDGVDTHFTGYSWIYGDFNESAGQPDLDFMKKKLDLFLNKIDPSYTMYFMTATEYFPHVSGVIVMQKFYTGLDQIQGKGGVYYATTLLTFETMNNAIEMGESFVKRYF